MLISGFTFVKNATKLYFPIKESILSILPICDEFVIAIDPGDEDDKTKEILLDLKNLYPDKIKIIETKWDVETYYKNTVYARQTDIAKDACKGKWLFYIQSDEAVHEKYLPMIKNICEKYQDDKRVEGLLFSYKHFWGDFWHYHVSHNWYPFEIRVIKNDPMIHSWRDAQSFRRFNTFNYTAEDYLRKDGTEKLNVIKIKADIYHYGCVRPPELMVKKVKKMDESYHGKNEADKRNKNLGEYFDYGPLNKLKKFDDSHPLVMTEWIQKFNWKEKLQYTGEPNPNRDPHTHEKLKIRIHTFIEQKILRGRHFGSFKNYNILEIKE